MELYKKPVVLLNEELSEGVYAASGDVGGSAAGSGGVKASVKLTSQGNEYYKVNGYEVTISNDGNEPATDWSVTLHVTGTATGLTSYDSNFSISLDGDTITITPVQWADIPAGGSKSVSFALSYSGASIDVA